MRKIGGRKEVDPQNQALIKNVIMDLTLLYAEKKKKFTCPPKLLAYFPTTEFLSVH